MKCILNYWSPFVFAFSLYIGLNACSKSSNSKSSSSADFLEVTISGKTYNSNNTGIFGYSPTQGCDSKNYAVDNIGQINTANYLFEADLNHYLNYTDFSVSKTGGYNVQLRELGNPILSCNMDLEVFLKDNNLNSYNLQAGGSHIVTNIAQKSQTTTSVFYTVSGTFSCNFSDTANHLIPITGKYQFTIETLK